MSKKLSVHANVQTYNKYLRTDMHFITCKHKDIHTFHTHICRSIHTHTHVCKYKYIRTKTKTHTKSICAYVTHTHTHTHICVSVCVPFNHFIAFIAIFSHITHTSEQLMQNEAIDC